MIPPPPAAVTTFRDDQRNITFDIFFLDKRFVLYATQYEETALVSLNVETAEQVRSAISQYLAKYKPRDRPRRRPSPKPEPEAKPKPESNHKTAAMSARQIIEQRRKQRK